MLELVTTFGLVALFLLMVSNGIVSAPPSEATIAAGGFLVAYGALTLVEVMSAVVLGNVFGASILYSVGRSAGESRIIEFGKKLLFLFPRVSDALFSHRTIEDSRTLFTLSPILLLGVLRCVPVVRSIVSLPAGAYRIPYAKFLAITTIGCTVWALLWCLVGYFAYSLYSTSRLLQLGLFIAGLLGAYIVVRGAIYRALKR